MCYGDFKTKKLNYIFAVKNGYPLKGLNLASYSLSQTTIQTHPCLYEALAPFGYLGYRIKTCKIYSALLSTKSSEQGYKYKHFSKQPETTRKFWGFFSHFF